MFRLMKVSTHLAIFKDMKKLHELDNAAADKTIKELGSLTEISATLKLIHEDLYAISVHEK